MERALPQEDLQAPPAGKPLQPLPSAPDQKPAACPSCAIRCEWRGSRGRGNCRPQSPERMISQPTPNWYVARDSINRPHDGRRLGHGAPPQSGDARSERRAQDCAVGQTFGDLVYRDPQKDAPGEPPLTLIVRRADRQTIHEAMQHCRRHQGQRKTMQGHRAGAMIVCRPNTRGKRDRCSGSPPTAARNRATEHPVRRPIRGSAESSGQMPKRAIPISRPAPKGTSTRPMRGEAVSRIPTAALINAIAVTAAARPASVMSGIIRGLPPLYRVRRGAASTPPAGAMLMTSARLQHTIRPSGRTGIPRADLLGLRATALCQGRRARLPGAPGASGSCSGRVRGLPRAC